MRRSWVWFIPLAIAATIVWLSQQPSYPFGISLPSPLDKVAHATAFGALAFSLELALRRTRHEFPLHRRHIWVFLATACFGATDEWHQYFIPGRDCSAFDWLADSVGAAVGLALSMGPFFLGSRSPEFGWWRGLRARPEPSRPLILVADPHWGETLTGLQEATARYPEADWLFLGDVFEVWVGLPGLENEAQQAFLSWVQARRRAQRWVGLWLGNREYFLDRFSGSFDLLGEGTGGALPAEHLAFEHGDLVNRVERRYRLWNVVSRSAFLWLLVRALPASWARKLVLRLERSLRTANRNYRLAFPREAFAAAAAEVPEAVFLTGHFHTHEVSQNGVALPWAHEGAFARWDQGRLELLPATVPPDSTFVQLQHP
jgi:UDP-2,3-diacylglucosamine pyrophosphatase LpxH